MLDNEIASSVSLQFNHVRKCQCMVIGRMYKTKISPMVLGGQLVQWCDGDLIKYLGIYLITGKYVKFKN